MADLDEISRAIGEMQSQHKESERQRSRIFKLLDEIKDRQGEINGAINLVVSRLDSQNKRIEVVEKSSDDFIALKNRGLGVIWVIGLAGGSIGAAVVWLVSYLTQSGGAH